MASQQPMVKNATARIVFPIYDEVGDLLSGATGLASSHSLDGGAFGACSNTATEIGTTGWYYLDLLAVETNGDVVAIQTTTTSATGKTSCLVFYTSGQTLDAAVTVTDAIKLKTDVIGASVAPANEYDTQLDANISTRAPAGEYNTQMNRIDVVLSTRAPAGEYNTPMSKITANVATEAKQNEAKTVIDLLEDLIKNKMVVDVTNSQMILYNDAGTTPLLTWDLADKGGNPISVAVGVPTQRGVPS
jgi:hypothetical protein